MRELVVVDRMNLPTSRSTAYSKFDADTSVWQFLAACKAASLHTLAISAPENPGVNLASFPENCAGSESNLISDKCFSKMSLRSCRVGKSISIWRSNLPGLSNA